MTVLFSVDPDDRKAAKFALFTLCFELTPLFKVISNVLIIDLGVMKKESDGISSTVAHAEILNRD